MPYALAFELEAEGADATPALTPAKSSLALGPAGLAQWQAMPPQPRARDMPMLNATVTFRER